MPWQKSPDDLVERFGRVLDRFPEVERRKMFGYPAAFVGGNMVTGLHERNWVIRLAEADRAEAVSGGAATFEPMPGRPMKNFVALPAAWLADDDAVVGWVERAIANGRRLPRRGASPVSDGDLDPREADRARRRDRDAEARGRDLMRPGMGKVFKQIQDKQAKAVPQPTEGARKRPR